MAFVPMIFLVLVAWNLQLEYCTGAPSWSRIYLNSAFSQQFYRVWHDLLPLHCLALARSHLSFLIYSGENRSKNRNIVTFHIQPTIFNKEAEQSMHIPPTSNWLLYCIWKKNQHCESTPWIYKSVYTATSIIKTAHLYVLTGIKYWNWPLL